MAIKIRRGKYEDLNINSLQPGEIAAVLEGDPAAEDGKTAYVAFAPGDVKRILTETDLKMTVDNGTPIEVLPENLVLDTCMAYIRGPVCEIKIGITALEDVPASELNRNLKLRYFEKVNLINNVIRFVNVSPEIRATLAISTAGVVVITNFKNAQGESAGLNKGDYITIDETIMAM